MKEEYASVFAGLNSNTNLNVRGSCLTSGYNPFDVSIKVGIGTICTYEYIRYRYSLHDYSY